MFLILLDWGLVCQKPQPLMRISAVKLGLNYSCTC